MRAVIVGGPSRDQWREETIAGDLRDLQRLVGGLIEALPIPSDVATVFLNEEGKLMGLTPTAVWTTPQGELLDALCGVLVILGPVDKDGNTTELTDKALAYVRRVVKPAAEVREAMGLLCPYCLDGWAMVPTLGPMRFEKHVYPKDYKGMRAGIGPGCQAHRIREILQ